MEARQRWQVSKRRLLWSQRLANHPRGLDRKRRKFGFHDRCRLREMLHKMLSRGRHSGDKVHCMLGSSIRKIVRHSVLGLPASMRAINEVMAIVRNLRKRLMPRCVSLLLALIMVAGLAALAVADDLSICLDAKTAPEAAINACDRLISSRRTGGKNRARAYDYRGTAYYRKGDYDRAIRDYNEAIRLDPKNAALYNNRGFAYHEKGDYDRAMRDYDDAIQLDASLAAAYVGRGLAYNRKGNYDRAIRELDEAIRLDPKSAVAFNNRGLAYDSKGDYDRAIRDYNEAIRLDPKDAVAYSNRGSAYNEKGDYDRAIRDLDEAIRLNPKYPNAYSHRSFAYGKKGDYDRAMADLNKAIELNPK
jgi:tetratricopeptide (TPR) repeat protein